MSVLWRKYRNSGYELAVEQRDKGWFDARIGKCTGSICCSFVGESYYKTQDEAIKEIVNGPKAMDELGTINTSHGIVTEDRAKEKYEKHTGKKVLERSLVVPKWNHYIGASTDGDVLGTDGCIEIKCPKRMYFPVERYVKEMLVLSPEEREEIALEKKNNPSRHLYKHIKTEHYYQMVLTMKILEKRWCDYVIYCSPEDSMFIDRVYFSDDFWDNDLYPRICDIIETKLKPRINHKTFVIPSVEDSDSDSDDITI